MLLLIALGVGSALGSREAGASLYVDYPPWLTPEETLERLTNQSGAIVVAQFMGASTRHINPRVAGDGRVGYELEKFVTLHPARWLKGPPETRSIEARYNVSDTPTFLELPSLEHGRFVIAFLTPRIRLVEKEGRLTGVERTFIVNHISTRVQELFRPLTPESLEAQISDYVQREDLSEQFRTADFVAVVELKDSLAIRGTHRIQRAVLREQFKGNLDNVEFWIDSPRIPLPSQRVLFFAMPGSDGQTWTGLKGFGGIRTLRGGVVEGTTRSLDELRPGPE